MNYLILPDTNKFYQEYIYDNKGELGFVEFLPMPSNVIICIGKNNTRKSRFLRNLLTEENHLIANDSIISILKSLEKYINKTLSETDGNFLNHRILQSVSFTSSKFDLSGIRNFIEYSNENKLKNKPINHEFFTTIKIAISEFIKTLNEDSLKTLETHLTYLHFYIDAILNFHELTKKGISISSSIEFKYRGKNLHQRVEILESDLDFNQKINQYLNTSKSLISPNKIYIPTLRGSVILINSYKNSIIDKANPLVYENTVRKNYNLSESITVSTGLNLYFEIKRVRNSKREIRDKFESFEFFLSENFFSGSQIDIVSLEEDSIIHIFLEGDMDLELFNLGDGIQSLIILLYPIFTAPKESWIFIEEPEINLHPGLQSLFLSTLLHNETILSKNLKFFISTHSNHLLDSILINEEKCTIYSFEKEINSESRINRTIIKPVVSPDASLLNLIGVHNSSVLLANVTIWVEGVTDRKYIKAYLDAYSNQLGLPAFIEGFHYSFIEYAGSNLKHYLFDTSKNENDELIKSMSLSNRAFVLADKDEGKEKKHSKLLALNSKIFEYTHTGAIEIENTISPTVLNLIINDVLRLSNEFTINYKDFEEIKLGNYLTELVTSRKLKPPKLESDSGSLSTYYKNKFADYVFEQVTLGRINWSLIKENPHAERITTKIYNFIEYNNSSKK